MRKIYRNTYGIIALATIALPASALVLFSAKRHTDAVPFSLGTPPGETLISRGQSGTTMSTNQAMPAEHAGVLGPIKLLPTKQAYEKNVTTGNPLPRSHQTEVMAWVYPGEPACNARNELSDGRTIDVLKIEYFRVEDGGILRLLDETSGGCNGFSKESAVYLKRYAEKQYVTVSAADTSSMSLFLQEDERTGEHVTRLVRFVDEYDFTGVEIDFEDFGNWNQDTYDRYKQFITRLGTELHRHKKKLMVDGPATGNAEEEAWYTWRYNDFAALPVDQLVVMAYDYEYDKGAGSPVAPLAWIEAVIRWTLAKYPDRNRLAFGIPSYGYGGSTGTQHVRLFTGDEIRHKPGFERATRDDSSGEMTWEHDGTTYFYQDSRSIALKREVIERMGIRSISVWHLGGNPWFPSKY